MGISFSGFELAGVMDERVGSTLAKSFSSTNIHLAADSSEDVVV